MLFEHRGKRPFVHETAVVAPTAVLCGDVTIGPRSHIGFGTVIMAQGSPVVIGTQSIIRENVVVRATAKHPVEISDYVLVGPNTALYGCSVETEAFLATGVTIFHGAIIGRQSEVRINGVVHVRTVLPANALVPIGWVAVGNPAEILPPNQHEQIWEIQKALDFSSTVYGVERSADGRVDMKEITRRLHEDLAEHGHDQLLAEN
jgi:carbonic anhydrase/acetyltransferase-like protein (isoleucine patch superfamily)